LPPAASQEEGTLATTEYSVVIDARGKQITGICVISLTESGNIVGTIVNEFGVRAFDFTFDGKKAKLENVFPPLDKWYIRRILRRDMTFLLSNLRMKNKAEKRKRSITIAENGEIVMTSRKYNIVYTFKPLNDEQ